MKRLLRLLLLSLFLAFILTATVSPPSFAGEVEADVIFGGIETFVDEWSEDWGPDDFTPYGEDSFELFMDSQEGSYCETYAATFLFWVTTMNLNLDPTNDSEAMILGAQAIVFYSVVLPEMDRLETACRNES